VRLHPLRESREGHFGPIWYWRNDFDLPLRFCRFLRLTHLKVSIWIFLVHQHTTSDARNKLHNSSRSLPAQIQ
jgi:hypothetical protein